MPPDPSGARPWVMGISASHNGASCLLHGDTVVAAVQEERLTRRKRGALRPWRPFLSWQYCLNQAGIRADELSAVVVCAQGSAEAFQNRLHTNPQVRALLDRVPILSIPHHRGHAISAVAGSGFADAAVLVVDGVGSPVDDLDDEGRAALVDSAAGHEIISLYAADAQRIRCVEKHATTEHLRPTGGLPGFGSLGMMYGAVALQIFGDALEAGKVMGLAPYGRPIYPVHEFLRVVDDRIEFTNAIGARFPAGAPRLDEPEAYRDLAASVQQALEAALDHLIRRLRGLVDSPNLAYAGGVALNGIANERIHRSGVFERVHVVPASDDSGAAIGAAFHGLWQLEPPRRRPRAPTRSDALGASYSAADVDAAIERTPGLVVSVLDDVVDVVEATVERLLRGEVVGWFQGRSELGPRALGNRSILLDPRRPDGKAHMNERVKFREGFRPFAPAILEERAEAWFELDDVPKTSPFMLRIPRFRAERAAEVPAVVHVDGTGRMQTVAADVDPLFHRLLLAFERRTGVPILLNTSFNAMGETIVETPEDALWCLLTTGMDACVLGDRLVTKTTELADVLDLVPRRLGEPAGRGEGSFSVTTPWGPARTTVPTRLLGLVGAVDGARTGRELLQAGLAVDDGVLGERELRRGLLGLRRSRVLRLEQAPAG